MSSKSSHLIAMVVSGLLISSCSSIQGWFPSSGPTKNQIIKADQGANNYSKFMVKPLDMEVIQRYQNLTHRKSFYEIFGTAQRVSNIINYGDLVEVSIWEATPAMLFTGGSSVSTSKQLTVPEQMINSDGTITVPFVGRVNVVGKDPKQIETFIAQRLKGKANNPQIFVKISENNGLTATIVGEVNKSLRLPLTAKGEKLLDAIAAAEGVKQPIGKSSIQISRGYLVSTMPLDTIIRDPKQNITLKTGDVVTAVYQSNSFSVLGATNKNEEIPFEAQGISLMQALARSGGVQDNRANAKGVFLFRYEAVDLAGADWSDPRVISGKVPVVYQIDLTNPSTFLLAQQFAINDKDVLYVSNAPVTELNKFLGLLTSSLYSVGTLKYISP